MSDESAYSDDQNTDQEGQREGTAKSVAADADALFGKLKRWVKGDFDSKGQTDWRREAREDFAFEAGDQLTEDDKNILRDMNRPIVVFNRLGVTVDAVAGQEVANRQEVQFVPRTQGVVKQNELLTSAAQWFRQQCDAEDEESDAFRDTVVCGMGWTETSLNYEDNPEGDPRVDRCDPLEFTWDRGAKKRNLADMRRVAHIRRDVPISEARALCPGDPDRPFEDADYNATWIDDREAGEDGKPHENDANFYTREENNAKGENEDDNVVTLIRVQWWEKVPVWLMLDPTDPTGQKIQQLGQDEYNDLRKRFKIAGAPMPKCVKSTRKVYRQAYLGNVLLEIGDAPIKGRFSFNCITGKRDRNRNSFFGIVRAMKDPARWGNKWMSQTMHIMNTSAKGGIAAERGQFFDDDSEGESSWAKNDQVTFLKPGALGQSPKMMPKPVSQFPQSSFELMQFAVASLPAVSGVNIETLGMQPNGDQAAALDRQRKQSVMILLQPLFDSLRRYRKMQGRCMLFLIQNYLSDGRLIKIEGPDNAQYVPLEKQADAQYDVIVDEAPTSPNQKELTWTMLQQILPVIGKMLPPATWLALLKYSPLPTSAQKDISDSIQQSQQQGDPEQKKREAELQFEQQKTQAQVEGHKALTQAKIEGMRQEANTKREVAMHHAQTDALTQALTAPAAVGPDGQPLAHHGEQAAGLIMSVLGDLRRDMNTLAQALAAMNAPKKLIRDPQTGEVVGIAPMQG